ncbi:hypothetical protein ACFUJR_38110 [Streptomyces sp. NPDC057271]|uniref:hypothetical protein n=1 Tax=unclassified Streptomyces TaxID=2593676 RepID=UPI00363616D2
MQIAIEKADALLRLMGDDDGRLCLWPCDIAPPTGWREALTTTDRTRFLYSLCAEAPFSPVSLDKHAA